MHEPRDLPLVMVSGSDQFKGGRHLQYPKETPLANLYMRMLEMADMPAETFGNSSGSLNLLTL